MAVTKLRGWVAAPATTWERRALGAVAVLIGAVGLIGFGLSAIRVAHLVRPSMPEPWMAPAVPVSIDLGILAFAGLDLLLTRRHVRVWWLSWVHDGLCGATLTLNVAGEHTAVGLVAHGTTIALWFAAVKAATATVKAWSAPPQRLTLACWVLAPMRSARRWRGEKTAILDDAAPRGELAADSGHAGNTPAGTSATSRGAAGEAGDTRPRDVPGHPGADVPSAPGARPGSAPKLELVPRGKRPAELADVTEVVADLLGAGQGTPQRVIAGALRERGLAVPNNELGALIAQARRELTEQQVGGER